MLIESVRLPSMAKGKEYIVSDERKTRDLQALSRTILPFAKSILGKKGFVEIDLIANWESVVGEELAGYSLPKRIDFKRGEKTNGILYVMVPGGAFALELQHRENVILSKVNTYFGYRAVSQLKIIQNSELKLDDDEDKFKDKQKTLVTKEEENYIKILSEEVENPALQEMLKKLGRSVISNNKGEKKKDEV